MNFQRKFQEAGCWIMQHPLLLGSLSIVWLALRTGTKPSRVTYPCQKAALAHSITLFSAVLPIFSAVPGKTGYKIKKKWMLSILLLTLALLGGYAIILMLKSPQKALTLDLSEQQATSTPASEIFVANGTITELVDLMGSKGLLFYNSQIESKNSGPGGLFGKEDIVIIKVNCQWDERGGTNTDLLKELIGLILNNPEGFSGEIVVADNGQGSGSLNWADNNAVNRSQSVEAVVALYASRYNVSTYLWDRIANAEVKEYDQGDIRDGYIVASSQDAATGVTVSYPKFRTAKGSYISFKYGIWDPDLKTYNSSRLKVINFPVLKSHSVYGVTAAIKHYMGVISQPLTNTHDYVGRGALGKVMVETRVPILNILDAIWINAIPGNGPDTSYDDATQIGLVLASVDPVALDYWASKHILLQTAMNKGQQGTDSLDPDSQSSQFNAYLRNSLDQLVAAGYRFTMDESRITVYISGRS